MIAAAYYVYLLLLAAAVFCSLWRLLRGPSIADRLNSADVIALCCVGLAVGQAWKEREGLWLDVAMVAGLVLFVGTTAVSLFLDPEDLTDSDK